MKKMQNFETKIQELQTTLANKLWEVDCKVKENYDVECLYNGELHNSVMEYNTLRGNLTMYMTALKMNEEGKNIEMIQTEVAKMKTSILNNRVNYLRKLDDIKIHLENLKKYNEEELKELEDIYEKVVYNNHPAVILPIEKEEVEIFNKYKKAYFLNDYEMMKRLLREEPLKAFTLEQKRPEALIKQLENNIQGVSKQMEELNKLNDNFNRMREIVGDEIKIGQSEMRLREDIYKLKMEVKKAEESCKTTFNGSVEF